MDEREILESLKEEVQERVDMGTLSEEALLAVKSTSSIEEVENILEDY